MRDYLPILTTPRLLLRGFQLGDAPRVASLAGDIEIARMTSNIPHPYQEENAVEWIQGHKDQFLSNSAIHFAIVKRDENLLIGAIGLTLDPQNLSAELGYWIGKPFWNCGFASEAAQMILKYAFEQIGLNRVEARHMTKNPASGRVMQKIGMTYEGTLRQSIYRFGKFEDVALYSILRQETIR